jgi:Na+/H+-dicarboxylate symporter
MKIKAQSGVDLFMKPVMNCSAFLEAITTIFPRISGLLIPRLISNISGSVFSINLKNHLVNRGYRRIAYFFVTGNSGATNHFFAIITNLYTLQWALDILENKDSKALNCLNNLIFKRLFSCLLPAPLRTVLPAVGQSAYLYSFRTRP